ncbi:MAG: hypothetical protein ACYCQI_10620 [Gammaproteobacteria bacterium]
MAGSQKQFDTDIKEAEKITAPLGVVNTMLGYEGSSNAVRRTAAGTAVSLVSTLFNSIKTLRLRELLTAIVSGDPTKAKAILEIDPSLLREKLEEKEFVLAPTGHKFNLKPYQAALAVDDTQMADMIKSYFAKLGDEKEADRQFDEQHPKGWEAAETEKWKPVFEQRDRLLDAICDSKEDDITSSGKPYYIATEKKGSLVEKELVEFYRLLDATLNEVITAGKKPFPPHLLLESWQVYYDDKLYKEYFGGNWQHPRALFFVQKIIGYEGIQRFMPVNYVQAYQDWLDDAAARLRRNQPQQRGTSFKIFRSDHWEEVAFYPLQARGTPGFSFAIYGGSHAGVGRGDYHYWLTGHPRASRLFEAYIDQKKQAYRSYAPRLST